MIILNDMIDGNSNGSMPEENNEMPSLMNNKSIVQMMDTMIIIIKIWKIIICQMKTVKKEITSYFKDLVKNTS
ncbi:hypothetical protein [Spiroplasma endosymbiont of Asaphidion curtum]|uniref:hypothetical protein n=1 Tax=Spiroplasma endosymbiont of Asaphidion curtum TaxID=3066281 RepID=UPI00313E00B9